MNNLDSGFCTSTPINKSLYKSVLCNRGRETVALLPEMAYIYAGRPIGGPMREGLDCERCGTVHIFRE
jgi:hypothetical protein